jgi:hypothetical protein
VPGDRPIIVVGCPRSGTTLLQVMLHAHPRIAIPPETRFVLTGYKNRHRFGDLADPVRRRALADWIVRRRQTFFHELGLSADDVTARIVAGPPTLGSAFAVVLRAYADRFGKPRWGDKRPAYLQHLPVICRLFPDAQVVNIVRDGRDCVASLKSMPWNRKNIYQSIATWTQGVDNGRWAARSLGPGSYFEMSYERLVGDPRPELARLCAFLGEEYDEAMAVPAALASSVIPQRKSWHDALRGPVTTARVGTWRDRLEPWEAGLCELAMRERLVSLGYELSGAEPPGAVHRARYLAELTRGRLVGPRRALVRGLDRLRGAPEVRAVPLVPEQRGHGEW